MVLCVMNVEIEYTTGYAGTGKSTELIELTKKIPAESSVVLAPTHKALYRLKNNIQVIELRTIHALLGWIPTINENATRIEHIDATIKLNKSLEEYSHIVIDEAGMMSEEMLMEIVSKLDMLGYDEDGNISDPEIADKVVVLHLFLDPYQLLPVQGIQIQVDKNSTKNLTTQYRSEAKDIVKLYTSYVTYLASEGKVEVSDDIEYSENIHPFKVTEFKYGDRLLAYTNKAVGAWNKCIAKQLNITGYIGQEVQLGNKLETVTVDNWYSYTNLDSIKRDYESGRLKLQNSKITKKFLDYSLQALLDHKDIQFIISAGYIYPVIVGIYEARKILHKAKEKAIKNRSMYKHIYTLGRAFIMDYTFATTVHKAQGNEFDTVFIDKEDIKKAMLKDTYYRLMYVSISRCKNNLYI